jgi:hypothetical protein
MRLYNFFQSGTTYRLRIALNLKYLITQILQLPNSLRIKTDATKYSTVYSSSAA